MEFKLQVIEAAKKSSNREQARIHNIHESVIRRWRKDDTAARITQAVMTPDKLVKNRLPGTYFSLHLYKHNANLSIVKDRVNPIPHGQCRHGIS